MKITRNFPTVNRLSRGSNYSLKKNQPYGSRIHSDRLVAVGRYLGGESIHYIAKDIRACTRSIKNWTRTFSDQVERLDG